MATLQEQMNSLHAETRQSLRDLGQQYLDGRMDARRLGHEMADLLEESHTKATVLGRYLGGDFALPEEDDRLFAQAVVDRELDFLRQFTADLEAGNLSDAETLHRAGSYAGKLYGTGNEAWGLASDDTATYLWRLGLKDHCEDCLELSHAGPWLREDLPTVPGACDTLCLFNCGCSLIRSDGETGFQFDGSE